MEGCGITDGYCGRVVAVRWESCYIFIGCVITQAINAHIKLSPPPIRSVIPQPSILFVSKDVPCVLREESVRGE